MLRTRRSDESEMLMTQDTFDLLQLWIKALQTDLVARPQWMDWAISEIERSEQPESWICELATTATREAALDILYAATRGSATTLQWLNDQMLSLGVLYSRYGNGQLALDQLLREAGDQADRNNALEPSCETYYALLTELEQGKRPRAAIESAVGDLFGQPLLYAKGAFLRISVEL